MHACVRIGLAVVALAMVSPPALAASEKPTPAVLWEAFPLDPREERPAAPLLPPEQGRSEATTVTEVPPEGSRSNSVVLALGAAAVLLLLAAIGVVSARRLLVHRHPRSPSVPLWQGITWPHSSASLRELQESRATGSVVLGGERRAANPHPDVTVSRYRWADQTPGRRSRPSVSARIQRALRGRLD